MKNKIKSATLGYTLEPLSRKFAPVHHESLFHFWYHVFSNFFSDINEKLRPWTTNGRKYNNRCEKIKAVEDFNKQRELIHLQFGNHKPYNQENDINIHKLKFGSI